ncbi:MAG: hypothetical protein KDB10_15995, partial [Acidimicrobiales bacterium]|nr:hypothetical protein [Acidimicrobiales bacterium]
MATLAERFERRLVVVVAGAGYGKTTLLAQALRDNGLDPRGVDVWVQVGSVDRTPAHLVASLARALAGDPGAADDVEGLADLVLLRAPEEVALVVDDAHRLDGSEAWDVLAGLADRLPRNGHLVVSGRTRPPLGVRRHQSTGDAVVLGEDDLAFDGGEVGLLATSLGVADGAVLPPWPALAVLSATAGHAASLEYLWEELLEGLSAERRRALAVVARLERFDDELVAVVTGGAWTASALVDGLPLTDAVGDSRRLHDLLREALTDELSPSEWRPLLADAADVLVRRGELVRASGVLAESGDRDGVVRLVRQYVSLPISARLSRTDAVALADLLPASERAGPVGRGLESVLAATPREVEAALRRMLDEARAAGDDEMRSLAWWRLVQLEGDSDPAGLTVTPELQELADGGWPLARSAIALVRSHDAQEARDVPAAIEVLDDLGGPHPETRRVALASRYVALGHPELVPVSLDEVLADGVADPVAAQAVWYRGDIDPDVAWPIASGLPATYRQRRLAAVEVPLLSMIAAVGVSAGAFRDAGALVADALGRTAAVAPRLALFAHVADALQGLVDDGEDEFVDRFAAAEELVAVAPFPAWAHLGALCAIRALVDGTSWLDGLGLGPAHTVAVAAGRALVAVRQGDGGAAAAELPWSEAALLRVHVPPPLLYELALAAGTAAAEAVRDRVPAPERWARRALDHPDELVRARAVEHLRTLPQRPPHGLVLRTFGDLVAARVDGTELESLERRRRLRQLLARLVVDRSVGRAELAGSLWPDLAPDQAANNLRVTLAKLLAVLEPERADRPSWWIRSVGDRLELNLDGLDLDVDRFDTALRHARAAEAQGASALAYEHYDAALALYRGPFLADLDDAEVLHERLRLQSLAYAAACRLAEFEAARGEPEAAMEHALAALRIDELGERAHRILIGCHLALGATDAARATAGLLSTRMAAAGTTVDELRAR